MLPERDFRILESTAHYYTLTRAIIADLLADLFKGDDGRACRKRLAVLHEAGLINRTHMQVSNPLMGAPSFVYYPSAKGCAFLAQEREDDRYLSACTLTPNWQHLYHWVEVACRHILLDRAVALREDVCVPEWLSEWSIANPDEQEPCKRYRLYTRINEKVVCAPDAGFLLVSDGHAKIFYVEQDRDTTKSADRVAAQKCQGYAGLAEQKLHTRHFPATNDERFSVLVFAPTAKRRDSLRKAFSTKSSCWLYKFASLENLTPATLLTGNVWYPCVGDKPAALLLEGE